MAEWNPTTFQRFEEGLDTSMGTARIVTDAGKGYIKALGNRQGPHPLACELVGTQLARWFGLPTLDFALMQIDAEVDEIPFRRGGSASSGTAFVTRAAEGHTWDGSEQGLANLENPNAVASLVVFDTWTLNCDRHPPDLALRRPNYDNVFLEKVGGSEEERWRLLAIDHTHCFTCGRDLTRDASNIDHVKDERLYGLFPAFRPQIRAGDLATAVRRLGELTEDIVVAAIGAIPEDWQVNQEARDAVSQLLVRRAAFLRDRIEEAIARQCWPDRLFDA